MMALGKFICEEAGCFAPAAVEEANEILCDFIRAADLKNGAPFAA
jgi:hypothetical protein